MRPMLSVEHCPLHHDSEYLEEAVAHCFAQRNHPDRFVADDARIGARYWVNVLRWTRTAEQMEAA